MGLQTFDKWPDGSTTIDKEHWSSKEQPPEKDKKRLENLEDISNDVENEAPTEDGDNLGLKIALRPVKNFIIMRVEFPEEIIEEINTHVDEITITANDDFSSGLVGQLKNDKKSAQLDFDLTDEVGKTVKTILNQVGTTYVQSGYSRDANADVIQCWINRSFAGDYNPYHDHGVQTLAGLSGFLWLKVPECIAKKDGDVLNINNASGGVDGFTQLVWGTNTKRDILQLKPQTEEYVKPEVGTMLLFPNWLKHAVMPFYGEGERRSMAFNWNVHDTDTEMRKYMSEHEEQQFDKLKEKSEKSGE